GGRARRRGPRGPAAGSSARRSAQARLRADRAPARERGAPDEGGAQRHHAGAGRLARRSARSRARMSTRRTLRQRERSDSENEGTATTLRQRERGDSEQEATARTLRQRERGDDPDAKGLAPTRKRGLRTIDPRVVQASTRSNGEY